MNMEIGRRVLVEHQMAGFLYFILQVGKGAKQISSTDSLFSLR